MIITIQDKRTRVRTEYDQLPGDQEAISGQALLLVCRGNIVPCTVHPTRHHSTLSFLFPRLTFNGELVCVIVYENGRYSES